MGCGVWGVGFYRFSGGQLANFQGKSPGIFPPITPGLPNQTGSRGVANGESKFYNKRIFIIIYLRCILQIFAK